MRCKKATKSLIPEGGRSETIAREEAESHTSYQLLCIFTAEYGLRSEKPESVVRPSPVGILK